MSYPNPKPAYSQWEETRVIHQGQPGIEAIGPHASYSIALGRWGGVPCLGIRYNGSSSYRSGYPISRASRTVRREHPGGDPIWFILPTECNGLFSGATGLKTGVNAIGWALRPPKTAAEWIRPERAKAPYCIGWDLDDVLVSGTPSPVANSPASWALARGHWGSTPCLARTAIPQGSPQLEGALCGFQFPMN